MAIAEILSAKKDERSNGSDCIYNGSLKEALDSEPDLNVTLKNAFGRILEKNPDVRVIRGLHCAISRNAVSNQIIRYRDIFKLSGKPLNVPYVLWDTRGEEERALLVYPYEKYGYLYGKGLYLCMTDQGSEYENARNEMVAVCTDDADLIVETYEKMFHEKCGSIQRHLDRMHYHTYDELLKTARKAGEEQKEEAPKVLLSLHDRTRTIYQYVVRWFLLKKVLYVQYMVDKTILKTIHEGNVRQQRAQARTYADSIQFMSYSEMWRIGTDLDEEKR